MCFKAFTLMIAAAGLRFASAINLDVNSTTSIIAAAQQLAYGVQDYYHSNVSGAASAIGTFPAPSYWWEGGAIWGGMIDHWAYTNDTSWNGVITQALLAQSNAPDYNYMPPAYYASLGNDDQSYWALTSMSAAEYGFPNPSGEQAGLWLQLVKNVFDTQTARWDTSTCAGGLRWQIFESNMGWTYKNTISNGALFQMAARLARYTGNQTYVEWANKSWDWMSDIDLISPTYQVFDGTDDSINCTEVDHTLWTYNPAVLIYGAAMMANYTNTQIWRTRTEGLLTFVENTFFSEFKNATNVMTEPTCEPQGTCNYDQLAFKAFLARWMAKAAVLYPPIEPNVRKYLSASAMAAAQSCTGGDDGQTCGQKWYVGGYDGSYGVGQELSAMETVQALLLFSGNTTSTIPQHQQNVDIQIVAETTTYPLTAPTKMPGSSMHYKTSAASRSRSSLLSNTHLIDRRYTTSSVLMSSWSLIALLLVAGMALASGFGTFR